MNLISERFTRNSENREKMDLMGVYVCWVENGLETFVFVCSAYTNWGQTEKQPVLDRWIVGSPARQRIVNRIAVSSLDHSSSVRALCCCFFVLFLQWNEPPPCIDAAVNCCSMPLVIDFQSLPGPKLRCSHNYNNTLWSILHITSCNWYYIYSGWGNYSNPEVLAVKICTDTVENFKSARFWMLPLREG